MTTFYYILEAVIALAGGVCLWRCYRRPNRQLAWISGICLIVGVFGATGTFMRARLNGPADSVVSQRMRLLHQEYVKYLPMIGRHVAESHPDAKVLLILGDCNRYDPDGSKALAILREAVGDKLASVTVAVVPNNEYPVVMGSEEWLQPEDDAHSIDAAARFDRLCKQHPESTLIIDYAGLSTTFRPQHSMWRYRLSERPLLFLGTCELLEDIAPLIHNAWINEALVTILLTDGSEQVEIVTAATVDQRLEDQRAPSASPEPNCPVALAP